MGEPETSAPEPVARLGWRARGWLVAYALSFVLMLAAAATLLVSIRGFLASTQLLYVSAVLSGLAVVSAGVSLVASRRK